MPEETVGTSPPASPATNSSLSDPIATVSAFMLTLQSDIEAIRAGTLEESKARLIFKGRAHQIKMVELQLQHTRLTKGRVPEGELRLIQTAK